MFMAALCITDKNWKPPKCSSTLEWKNECGTDNEILGLKRSELGLAQVIELLPNTLGVLRS
jgi:hypothetical protein